MHYKRVYKLERETNSFRTSRINKTEVDRKAKTKINKANNGKVENNADNKADKRANDILTANIESKR
jgi:hypothetical protein